MFCVIPANKMNFNTENELIRNVYWEKAQAKSKLVWNKNCIQFDFSWTSSSVQYSRISKPTFHAISSSLVSSHPLSFSDLMDSLLKIDPQCFQVS